MSYTKTSEPQGIPTDKRRLAWFLFGLIAILGAALLIVVGFIVADRRTPQPTEGEFPERLSAPETNPAIPSD